MKIATFHPSSFGRAWLVTAFAALTLLGCGGGGGGGDGTATVAILDSFGQAVGADAGVGAGDSGADGTADAQGYYRVKVTSFSPPFVATATKSDGEVLHSLSVTALKVNGFITLNLSGLTDKVASDVAVNAGKKGAADLTPQIVAANSSAVAQAISNLAGRLSSVIVAAGLNPATFDPIGAPFRPNLTGYDFVLENVKVVVAADGSTQVTQTLPGASPVDKYVGTWNQCSRGSGSTDSEIETVTITKTGSTTASVADSTTRYASTNCSGAATGSKSRTLAVTFRGTKIVGVDTVDKVEVADATAVVKFLTVLLAKNGGLYTGREAGDGGALDSEGYPSSLYSTPFTSQFTPAAPIEFLQLVLNVTATWRNLSTSPNSTAVDAHVEDSSGSRIAHTLLSLSTPLRNDGVPTTTTSSVSVPYAKGSGLRYAVTFGDSSTSMNGCTISNGSGPVVDANSGQAGAYPTVAVAC
jgi:hypothetical protein